VLSWLGLACLVVAGCVSQGDALSNLERATNHLFQVPDSRLNDDIELALNIATDVPMEMREALKRFDAARQDPDAPGAVRIVIDNNQSPEAPGNNPRSRTVQLLPMVVDGTLVYVVRVNLSLYQFGPDGPPTLAMYLYGAELRREYNEEIRKSRGLDGDAQMDALISQPDGLLAAHYATWDKVVETVYLPWRQMGKIRAVASFDKYLADRANCPNAPSPRDCIRALSRTLVGL
jgi:hypothetical protein